MTKFLNGGEKPRKLNPYKRISKGVEKVITVDGEAVTAITDTAGKYSYLNVGGVDYYVSDALVEGGEYTTADVEPKPKAEPKAPVLDENGEPVAPVKRTRRKKAEVAAEEVAEAA